jgi:hypothetical protein
MNNNVDQARRALWRAFQRGTMSEEEFVATLDRLEFDIRSGNRGQDSREGRD